VDLENQARVEVDPERAANQDRDLRT